MKKLLYGICIASVLTGSTYAHNDCQALVNQLPELNEEQKAQLIEEMAGAMIRGGLPESLQPMVKEISLGAQQNEAPKHKSTNLSIAPAAAVVSGLPDVYSADRHGKQFALTSGAHGLLWGLLAIGAANGCMFLGLNRHGFRITAGIGIVLSALITQAKYKSLKNEYLENEERILLDFFAHKWEEKRKHISYPEYVTTRMNYLADKYNGRIEGATFDINEAREMLAALHEAGRNS